MKRIKKANKRKMRRKDRVRAKISGTAVKPRLSVFRSNRHIFAQLIDDVAGKTLTSVSSKSMGEKKKMPKALIAEEMGKMLAEKAKEKGIDVAVFDKGPYQYHGRVKALSDGAKKAGLKI